MPIGPGMPCFEKAKAVGRQTDHWDLRVLFVLRAGAFVNRGRLPCRRIFALEKMRPDSCFEGLENKGVVKNYETWNRGTAQCG